jgi:hypothetical protein
MNPTKPISLVTSLLVMASIAAAQTGDWQAVKDLRPGTKISVQYEHSFHNLCTLEQATDEQLVCDHVLHGPRGTFIPSERVYQRNNIREVRLEHSDGANTATAAALGGGVGTALGASTRSHTLTRGAGILLLGGIGALIGGSFGKDFPVIHGKVVYRR